MLWLSPGSGTWLLSSTCRAGWRRSFPVWSFPFSGSVSGNLCLVFCSQCQVQSLCSSRSVGEEVCLFSHVSSLMSLWFTSSFGISPVTVFSRPFSFDPGVLPLFYTSLLSAWRSLNGSFSPSHNSLAFGVGSALVCTPVAGMSTRSCYLYLLSENMVQPHCVDKFSFTFGPLE